MIIPCIDLMDGKVVQLVQGRDKALEGDAALAATVFHYGTYTVADLKNALLKAGVPVRPPQ